MKVNGVTQSTTYYVGNHYEVTNGSATKYYYFGKQRVAMRTSAGVTYLHTDHLGSTSATSGASVSSQTYDAYGNIRATTGSVPTDYGFTGQKRDASSGLMYYGARYYDAALGRFISPDTLVPNLYNPQDLNRYTYARNNPLRYTDPSGRVCVPCLVVIGVVALKVADYGWTAWDAWQAGQVLADPNASPEAKAEAASNLALTAAFEAAEPDDLLPVALPIDDLARKGIIKLGQEARQQAIRKIRMKLSGDATIEVAEKAGTVFGRIDPHKVRFSQKSISYGFTDETLGTIDDLAEGLRSGRIKPSDIEPIKVVRINGQLFTLDNRRLEAFRRAGLEISYEFVTLEDLLRQGWKFTTNDEGMTIIVRGEP